MRKSDAWDGTKWTTVRLGPKLENDFYDEFNGCISEKVQLSHWYREATTDGSTLQRQRALRSAMVHMNRAQELSKYERDTTH
jgi:hypothetical protein